MVSYCGVSDVKRFVFTSMTDADIQKSIEEADDWIMEEIGPQDGNKMEIRKLSALVTARDIKIRDPQSVAIGPSGRSEEHTSELQSQVYISRMPSSA